MHRLLPIRPSPRYWPPKLSPLWVRLGRPLRRWLMRHVEKVHAVELRGLGNLRAAVDGNGVLIAPNHFTYADPYPLGEAADALGRPFYFMTAWQVFGTSNWLKREVLRRTGCFSVDREGTDLRSFRQAVEIVQSKPNPLVVFPEGEMYHLGDRVTPFREGAAAIALAAAKRAERPVVCVSCGLKYYHLDDPTPELLRLADRLERALFWRPRPDLSLVERIYRIAEGALALKEIEHLGRTATGPLPQRIAALADAVLRRIEGRYGVGGDGSTPDRVKALRQLALRKLEGLPDGAPEREQVAADLDEVFFVVQLFSYPGDSVSSKPTLDRIAETLDKFEEDILGVPIAPPRGRRGVIAAFGEPVAVGPGGRGAAAALTRVLEERVQTLLDSIERPPIKG
jgi:1-acyl-sn-glycerol-3-phosphate acyltransferase